MALTASDYAQQLAALLPRGVAYQYESGSIFGSVLKALSGVLSRVDCRADDLLKESDPRLADELLLDWERVAGLPDKCLTNLDTVAQRRLNVASKLTTAGGQSRQYYIDYAAALGWAIEINEFPMLRAGFLAGGRAYGEKYAHAWEVQGAASGVFEAASFTDDTLGSKAGTELRTFPDNWGIHCFSAGDRAGLAIKTLAFDLLRCRILELIPAHTSLLWWSVVPSAGHFVVGVSKAGDPLWGCIQKPRDLFVAGDTVGDVLAVY